MSTLRLTGSTSGYTEVTAPAVAGSNTLVLPSSNGSAHQLLKNSGTAGTLEYGVTLPSGNGLAHQLVKNSASAGTWEYGVTLPSGNGLAHQLVKNSASAGTWEYGFTLPSSNGTADQALVTDGSGTLSFADRGRIVLETSKSATGTSVEFTGIPSWAKRIQVIHAAISTDGTNPYFIQIGAGSYAVSGYASSANISTYSTGLVFANNLTAATLVTGISTLLLVGSNLWVHASVAGANSGNSPTPAHGSITLGGTLDRLRLISSATGSPSSTWDAGDFNIVYEG